MLSLIEKLILELGGDPDRNWTVTQVPCTTGLFICLKVEYAITDIVDANPDPQIQKDKYETGFEIICIDKDHIEEIEVKLKRLVEEVERVPVER